MSSRRRFEALELPDDRGRRGAVIPAVAVGVPVVIATVGVPDTAHAAPQPTEFDEPRRPAENSQGEPQHTYTVTGGERVEGLAERFGVPVEVIILNNGGSRELNAGDVISLVLDENELGGSTNDTTRITETTEQIQSPAPPTLVDRYEHLGELDSASQAIEDSRQVASSDVDAIAAIQAAPQNTLPAFGGINGDGLPRGAYDDFSAPGVDSFIAETNADDVRDFVDDLKRFVGLGGSDDDPAQTVRQPPQQPIQQVARPFSVTVDGPARITFVGDDIHVETNPDTSSQVDPSRPTQPRVTPAELDPIQPDSPLAPAPTPSNPQVPESNAPDPRYEGSQDLPVIAEQLLSSGEPIPLDAFVNHVRGVLTPNEYGYFTMPGDEQYSYLFDSDTCNAERDGHAEMLAFAFALKEHYNYLTHTRPEYAAYKDSVLEMGDFFSHIHNTHSSEKPAMDFRSRYLNTEPGIHDGPAFVPNSPNYDASFTAELINFQARLTYNSKHMLERVIIDDPRLWGLVDTNSSAQFKFDGRGHNEHIHSRIDVQEEGLQRPPDQGDYGIHGPGSTRCEFSDFSDARGVDLSIQNSEILTFGNESANEYEDLERYGLQIVDGEPLLILQSPLGRRPFTVNDSHDMFRERGYVDGINNDYLHQGWDIQASNGELVYAPITGEVYIFPEDAGNTAGMGNVVMIKAADGMFIQLGHLKDFNTDIENGQIVYAGDHLARVGSSGATNGSLLDMKVGKFSGDPHPFSGASGDDYTSINPANVFDRSFVSFAHNEDAGRGTTLPTPDIGQIVLRPSAAISDLSGVVLSESNMRYRQTPQPLGVSGQSPTPISTFNWVASQPTLTRDQYELLLVTGRLDTLQTQSSNQPQATPDQPQPVPPTMPQPTTPGNTPDDSRGGNAAPATPIEEIQPLISESLVSYDVLTVEEALDAARNNQNTPAIEPQDVYYLARSKGATALEAATFAGLAGRESAYQPGNIGDMRADDPRYSWGLFQIKDLGGDNRDPQENLDPYLAMDNAWDIYQQSGLDPWRSTIAEELSVQAVYDAIRLANDPDSTFRNAEHRRRFEENMWGIAEQVVAMVPQAELNFGALLIGDGITMSTFSGDRA